MEFSPFIDVVGWTNNDFGYDIEVETCGFSETVVSTFSVSIIVDKTIDEISVNECAALAIPGEFEEFGFCEEAYDEQFLTIIKTFAQQNKVIATICVGALPVGKSGILTGKNATTYHLKEGYHQKQLVDLGVRVKNERIVIDFQIITSYCPETVADVVFKQN